MKQYKLSDIKKVLKQKGYEIYSDMFMLNLIGIRSRDNKPNEFDDTLAVFYTIPLGEAFHLYPFTTEPGDDYLEEPINRKGTAVLKEGQYPVFKIALHNGKYYALCQRLGPVTVYRDNDRDNRAEATGETETGFFGINIHHAGRHAKEINKHSAGCQVFQNMKDFDEVYDLAKRSNRIYGNRFTYTLINEADIDAVSFEDVKPEGMERV